MSKVYHNNKVFRNLNDKDKVLAEHIMKRNAIMEGFIMTKGWIDILDRPMCPRCEKPGLRDLNDTARCVSCGHTWKDYITFREYVNEYVKGISIEELERVGR